jgi:hypothetical protein
LHQEGAPEMAGAVNDHTTDRDTVMRAYYQAMLIGSDEATARICAERILHEKLPHLSLATVRSELDEIMSHSEASPACCGGISMSARP